MIRKKPSKIRQGDPCPHCGGHAFKIIYEKEVTVYRCLNKKCRGRVIVV